MSMRDLIIDLQDEIRLGALSFAEIAAKYEVPTSWVQESWDLLCSHDELERDWDEPYEPDYDGQPDEAQEWHDFDPDC